MNNGIIQFYDQHGFEYLRVNVETQQVVFRKTFTIQDKDNLKIIDIEDSWPEQVKFENDFKNVKVENLKFELEPGMIGPMIPISNGCREIIDKDKTDASIWKRAFSRMFK